jgi:Ser/Thr protein kinase RdoA (MazF antagonist)
MNHFPIAKSFLQRAAIARCIEEEYGFEQVGCQLITTTLRDVYLITSIQGRHILYVYRHGQRSVEEITAEWRFVDYLRTAGLPVAPAIQSKSGRYLLEFLAPEGIRCGVLTHFAEGVILRRRQSMAATRAYGQIVARIHTLSDRMEFSLNRPDIGVEKMIRQSVTAFEKEVFDRPNDLAFLRESAGVLQNRVGKLPKQKPAYGIIHGDVIRANALVSDNDQVTILDFDFCGLGWRAYDVASFLLTIRDTPQEKDFQRAFLEGYEQIRPLAADESKTLALFEAIRAMISIGIPAMNIEHWGRQYFDAFVEHDLAALKRCMSQIV